MHIYIYIYICIFMYTHSFSKNIGWKPFYENSGEGNSNPSNSNSGLKSNLTSPSNSLLNYFENTMQYVLKDINGY